MFFFSNVIHELRCLDTKFYSTPFLFALFWFWIWSHLFFLSIGLGWLPLMCLLVSDIEVNEFSCRKLVSLEAGMAVTVKQMSLAISFLGVLSFIFGVVAENKKVLYLEIFCFPCSFLCFNAKFSLFSIYLMENHLVPCSNNLFWVASLWKFDWEFNPLVNNPINTASLALNFYRISFCSEIMIGWLVYYQICPKRQKQIFISVKNMFNFI